MRSGAGLKSVGFGLLEWSPSACGGRGLGCSWRSQQTVFPRYTRGSKQLLDGIDL